MENKLNRNRKIMMVLVVFALGAGIFFMTGKKSGKIVAITQAKPALTVTAELPDLRNWPQKLSATGNVSAWQEASIGAEVSGLRLAELYVNVGDEVKKGQLLAHFADEMVVLDMEQQHAAEEEMRARLTQADAKAESSLKLRESGSISNLDNIQNQSLANVARAQLKAAEARTKVQKLRMGYTRVLAPDDGVISSRTATVGAVMQPGGEMFRYIRRNQLEWRAEVPEGPLQKIKVGHKVALHTSQGAVVNGKVSRISPVVDAQSRNGNVYVELINTIGLKAGMFAQGDFELGRSSALTVPQNALVVRDGFAYVFALDAENHATQTKVIIGRRLEGRIEIVEGLSEQAKVVVAGAGFLSDGDLVRLSDTTSSPVKNK
jgi:RND family efflux transporter MFP subunit